MLNHSIKFDIVSLTLHSSHLKNVGKFCNSMYYREFFCSITNFDSMNYLCTHLRWMFVEAYKSEIEVGHRMFLEKLEGNFLESSHGNVFKVIYHKPLWLLKMGQWNAFTPQHFVCPSFLRGLWWHTKRPSMWINQMYEIKGFCGLRSNFPFEGCWDIILIWDAQKTLKPSKH